MNISNRWLVIFMILPTLSIYYYTIGGVQPIVLLFKVIILIIAMISIREKISKINLYVIIFIGITIFSAVVNRGLSSGILFSSLFLIGFCLYISSAIKNPIEFFTGLNYLYSTVIYLNAFTVLIGGISKDSLGYPVYLLGGKNSLTMTVIPAICIICIHSYLKNNNLSLFASTTIFAGIVSLILAESGTGVTVALLVMVLFVTRIGRFFSFKAYSLIYTFLFFMIVVFQIQDKIFGNFIIDVLGKDITFTGRTYIWTYVLQNIWDSWIIGFGRGTSFITQNFSHLNETHNGILEVMVYSGMLGLLCFIIIILQIAKKLDENKNNNISRILSISIFSYMIIGLTESVFFKIEFWLLLIIAYNVRFIIESSQTVQLKNLES